MTKFKTYMSQNAVGGTAGTAGTGHAFKSGLNQNYYIQTAATTHNNEGEKRSVTVMSQTID